ncbi:MAG: hypothetical protein Q4D04_15505 [Clostridia bacterium]|nr:hypothetical protein [Clostridia bacterium]
MDMRKALIVLLILLLILSADAMAYMNINYDSETWPLEIALDGQGTRLAFKAGRLMLPDMTLVYCARGNLTGWNTFAQMEKGDARNLFSALSQASVRVSTKRRFSGIEDGSAAWFNAVARLPLGEMYCLDFHTTFGGEIHMRFQTSDYKDCLYFSSRSSNLLKAINRLAGWNEAGNLDKAQKLQVYDWNAQTGRGELLGEVKSAVAKKLSQAMTKTIKSGYQNEAQAELVFTMTNGDTASAYLVNPNSEQKK